MKTIVGAFATYADADAAVVGLMSVGYRREDINVIAPEKIIHEREVSEMAEGAAGGATIGGLAGLLLGLTTLTVPGIGAVLATASILGSTAIGAGIGATAGGLVGALVDLGVPESEARVYIEEVRRGNVLVAVNAVTREQVGQASGLMKEHNAMEVRARQRV